jgi:hypothetical protein
MPATLSSPFYSLTTMPSETATCPGCDNTFTLRGYQSHLALSRDPLCRAVFDKLKIENDTYDSEHHTASAEEDSRAASDTEAVPFQGDAFGTAEDYILDMFGQTEVDNNMADSDPNDLVPTLMEVSDDEDDTEVEDDDEEITNMVAELEKSWEPPREGAPQARQEAEDDQQKFSELQAEENDDDDSDSGYTQRRADQFIIGDGYGVKPAVRISYNDKHPSARAGQPLTHEESTDYGYDAALGGGDNSSPWMPFNSKKDWEIARWAKLRGVGSTAFSDLLAINGVGFSSFFPILRHSERSI